MGQRDEALDARLKGRENQGWQEAFKLIGRDLGESPTDFQ